MLPRDPAPPHDEPASRETATRPLSLWPQSTRPAELPSTAFDASRFDPRADERARADAQAAAVDICRPDRAGRSLLLVQAAVVVAALVAGGDDAVWRRVALASGAGLAGSLAWVASICAVRSALHRLARPARAALAVGLGAAAGWVGATPLWALGLVVQPGVAAVLGVGLAGAGLAALLWGWLDLLARVEAAAVAGAGPGDLRAHIRPLFLFSALNTAIALVRAQPAQAERVLADLARLFRVALADPGPAVTLDEEIELARAYLAIEQVRFGPRLRVHFEIEARAGHARVPPLLLQPLLESAVRHGCEPAAGPAQIWVQVQARAERAVIEVRNTVPSDALAAGPGRGLTRLQERLRLLHAAQARCERWRDGRLHHVRIQLPL